MNTKVSIVGIILIAIVAGFLVYVSSSKTIVTNFEECAAAGNPVMESYPRQCNHEGEHFVEIIFDPIGENPNRSFCDANNRPEFCTQQYEPVCGLVNVQCVTTPCDPVEQTFSNACTACSNQLVDSYVDGTCEFNE